MAKVGKKSVSWTDHFEEKCFETGEVSAVQICEEQSQIRVRCLAELREARQAQSSASFWERALCAAESAENEDRLEDAEQLLDFIIVRLQEVMATPEFQQHVRDLRLQSETSAKSAEASAGQYKLASSLHDNESDYSGPSKNGYVQGQGRHHVASSSNGGAQVRSGRSESEPNKTSYRSIEGNLSLPNGDARSAKGNNGSLATNGNGHSRSHSNGCANGGRIDVKCVENGHGASTQTAPLRGVIDGDGEASSGDDNDKDEQEEEDEFEGQDDDDEDEDDDDVPDEYVLMAHTCRLASRVADRQGKTLDAAQYRAVALRHMRVQSGVFPPGMPHDEDGRPIPFLTPAARRGSRIPANGNDNSNAIMELEGDDTEDFGRSKEEKKAKKHRKRSRDVDSEERAERKKKRKKSKKKSKRSKKQKQDR